MGQWRSLHLNWSLPPIRLCVVICVISIVWSEHGGNVARQVPPAGHVFLDGDLADLLAGEEGEQRFGPAQVVEDDLAEHGPEFWDGEDEEALDALGQHFEALLLGHDLADGLDVLAVEVLAVDALEVVGEDVEDLHLLALQQPPHHAETLRLGANVREHVVYQVRLGVFLQVLLLHQLHLGRLLLAGLTGRCGLLPALGRKLLHLDLQLDNYLLLLPEGVHIVGWPLLFGLPPHFGLEAGKKGEVLRGGKESGWVRLRHFREVVVLEAVRVVVKRCLFRGSEAGCEGI